MAKITGTTYENGEITSVFVQALDEKPKLFEPARARGEWVYHDFVSPTLECSVCGGLASWDIVTDYHCERTAFCPNCGADMRGEDDEEE